MNINTSLMWIVFTDPINGIRGSVLISAIMQVDNRLCVLASLAKITWARSRVGSGNGAQRGCKGEYILYPGAPYTLPVRRANLNYNIILRRDRSLRVRVCDCPLTSTTHDNSTARSHSSEHLSSPIHRIPVSCALHSLWAHDSRSLRQELTRSEARWTSLVLTATRPRIQS